MNKDSLDFIFKPNSSITNELTVARMESLRKAALRAQPPKQVIGGKIRTTPGGWTLEIPKSGGKKEDHPFKVKVVDAAEREVTLTPGTLNNTIPLVGTDRMYVLPRPELTLPNVAIAGIYLKVTVDGSMEATAIEIVAEEIDTVTNTLDLQTGGVGYDLIASATIEDGSIVSIQQYIKTKVYHRAYLKHIFWT